MKTFSLFTNVGRVLDEMVLLSHLTFELISEMGSRLLWIFMTLRFLVYVILLLPAFWRCLFLFIVSENIEKGVPYGTNPRNFMDIYHPTFKAYMCYHAQLFFFFFLKKKEGIEQKQKRTKTLKQSDKNKSKSEQKSRLKRVFRSRSNPLKKANGSITVNTNDGKNKYPVVIFVTGGAWMIGYKAWGAFMGMLLAQLGILFVTPDYRNFPQVRPFFFFFNARASMWAPPFSLGSTSYIY
ncbi:hypothetical protein RFI_33447, partial [Reticulomyxa filosa]